MRKPTPVITSTIAPERRSSMKDMSTCRLPAENQFQASSWKSCVCSPRWKKA
jgi:hypothetical protein